jgi:hypothetical protein
VNSIISKCEAEPGGYVLANVSFCNTILPLKTKNQHSLREFQVLKQEEQIYQLILPRLSPF